MPDGVDYDRDEARAALVRQYGLSRGIADGILDVATRDGAWDSRGRIDWPDGRLVSVYWNPAYGYDIQSTGHGALPPTPEPTVTDVHRAMAGSVDAEIAAAPYRGFQSPSRPTGEVTNYDATNSALDGFAEIAAQAQNAADQMAAGLSGRRIDAATLGDVTQIAATAAELKALVDKAKETHVRGHGGIAAARAAAPINAMADDGYYESALGASAGPVTAAPHQFPMERWPIEKIGALRSGNNPELTVEEEHQMRMTGQGNPHRNDTLRARHFGFPDAESYQRHVTDSMRDLTMVNPAEYRDEPTGWDDDAPVVPTMTTGHHRYSGARILGWTHMDIRRQGPFGSQDRPVPGFEGR